MHAKVVDQFLVIEKQSEDNDDDNVKDPSAEERMGYTTEGQSGIE